MTLDGYEWFNSEDSDGAPTLWAWQGEGAGPEVLECRAKCAPRSALVATVARLRAALERAPHSWGCRSRRFGECDCYKAEARRVVENA